MAEVDIRIEGRAGRITLARPETLNALTHEMCREIDAALVAWRDDPAVALVLMDALGPRSFCAGGDIAAVHAAGKLGEFEGARNFWRDEYRMNARLAEYPKPVVSLMQGFVMGGGVGLGCHGHPRIVGETSQIAMPECGIGLIPDVGGTYLLARAPGHLGEYLGLTGARMGPADAIYAGFADYFIPEAIWPELSAILMATGDAAAIQPFVEKAPPGHLPALQAQIDAIFWEPVYDDILTLLESSESPFAKETLRILHHNAPLSLACTLQLVRDQRAAPDLRRALTMEYRYTYRAPAEADFLEGVRAAVIDKDRKPRWERSGIALASEVAEMLAPLGAAGLKFTEERR